jgi:hypothetical protein
MQRFTRMLRRASYALTLLFVLTSVAAARGVPQEFTATFAVSARGISLGRAQLTLEREGRRYHYGSRIKASGLIKLFYRSQLHEESQGELLAEQVRPRRYDYRRTGSKGRTDSIRFLPTVGQAFIQYKGESRARDVPAGVLDPLSLHLALMQDLALGAKQRMRYLVLEPRRLQAYALEVAGHERVATPAGEWDAVRVDLVGRGVVKDAEEFDLATADIPPVGEDERTSFWLAPELNYLVVRIRHHDPDEGVVDLVLEEFHSPRVVQGPVGSTSDPIQLAH